MNAAVDDRDSKVLGHFLAADGRLRTIELARIDGEAPSTGPAADADTGTMAAAVIAQLRAAGFTDSYRGLTFRS